MNRDEIRDKFSPLLDGELSPEERAEVEQALSEDADLLRELDGLKRVDDLYRALPRAAAPNGFENSVKARLRSNVRPFSTTPWHLRRLVPAMAAAIVLVSAVAIVWFQTQSGPRGTFKVASQPSIEQALESQETRAAGRQLETLKPSPAEGIVAGAEVTESRRDDAVRFQALVEAPAAGVQEADSIAPMGSKPESAGAVLPQEKSEAMRFNDFDFSRQAASASARRDGAREASAAVGTSSGASSQQTEIGQGAALAIPKPEAGISEAGQTTTPEQKLAEPAESEPDRLHARAPATTPSPSPPPLVPIETQPMGREEAAQPIETLMDAETPTTVARNRAEAVGTVKEMSKAREDLAGAAPRPTQTAPKKQVSAALHGETMARTVASEEAALDSAVISVALEDFIRADDAPRSAKREGKTVLLVDATSEGPGGLLSDAQIEADLMNVDWRPSKEIVENLRARNSTQVALNSLVLAASTRIVDLRTPFDGLGSPEPWTRIEKAYPEAIAAVCLWLPGYSKDKSQAVVRFRFGPTEHGATATYLLVKDGDSWKVKVRAFAYYL